MVVEVARWLLEGVLAGIRGGLGGEVRYLGGVCGMLGRSFKAGIQSMIYGVLVTATGWMAEMRVWEVVFC